MSCHCEHPHRCWSWSDPYPPYSWREVPQRDAYIRRLEREEELLRQRLQRVERELAGLRQLARPVTLRG